MQTKFKVGLKPIVSCQDVKFAYPSGQPVLEGVSLELFRGESTVLFGKSGSGKSTLLRCISGYNQPESGSLLVSNSLEVEVRDPDAILGKDSPHAFQMAELWQQMRFHRNQNHSWWDSLFGSSRSEQGYLVFSDCANALPQLTAEENLHLVLSPICSDVKLRRRVTCLLLQLTGLTAVAQQKPSALSSGQLRRLCLAQGLAINPGLLILDEPTNGLDFSTKTSFLYLVERLRQIVGMTILSVTHDLEAALLLADRLFLFRDGKILEEVQLKSPHPRKLEILDTKEFINLKRMMMDFLQ